MTADHFCGRLFIAFSRGTPITFASCAANPGCSRMSLARRSTSTSSLDISAWHGFPVDMCPPPFRLSVLAAEVRAPDLGIGEQLIARPLRARLPHDEDVPAPTQSERLPRVLLDQHDADAARVDVADPVEDQPLE